MISKKTNIFESYTLNRFYDGDTFYHRIQFNSPRSLTHDFMNFFGVAFKDCFSLENINTAMEKLYRDPTLNIGILDYGLRVDIKMV